MTTSTREPAQAAGRPAVEIEHLRKTYGTLVAVDDVSFSVAEGEIFGILGPNGAGKTRRDAWQLIEGVRDRGVTIVLVTHFMEEAERLCDRVALIDHGRIAALDTPANLTARAQGGKSVRFVPSAPFDDRLLTALPEVSRVEHRGQHVVVTGTGELVNTVILALHGAGLEARDVQLDTSSLEDAFVRLTGTHLHQEGEPS